MRLLSLLSLLASAVTGSLFQTYNGVIDGNVCTGMSPIATGLLTVPAPTNVAAGDIGIHQLAFQTVGDGYVYAGLPITINGVTGTYSNTCCSCDAIGQSINGGFSECGLTWCGQENQWQYLDFTGILSVQQNSTLTIVFPTAVPIADGGGGPVFSISYALAPLSPTGSASPTESRSPTVSLTASPTGSLSPSSSSSLTPSPTGSASPTASIAADSLSPTSSVTTSPSITISSSVSKSPDPGSQTASVTRSVTPSPAGICYSVSRLYGQLTVLGSYYYILPGFNVTQPYGSGFISMGYFVSCSVIGATCKCSYTGGSTVAGCGGQRRSYITYSYGSTDGYSFINESPTCSYNFAGTIGIPSSSRTVSPALSVSPSYSLSPIASFIPPTICQAALGRQGALEKVIGDVEYYVKHFVSIHHFRGVGIPDMFIGNYTGPNCSETATTCSCTYGPGEPTNSCPSGRYAMIDYQFGMSTYTTFFRQYPACHYYFLGSVGIMSPSPPISSTPSRSGSVTVTASYSSSISPTQTSSSSSSESLSPSITVSGSISGTRAATLSVTRTVRATSSVSPSITLSSTISASISTSRTATPSLTHSTSSSESITPSVSLTSSITLSITPSSSVSSSITGSVTTSESLTSSRSITISVTPSATLSESPSKSPSMTLTKSPSKSPSMTLSKSLSKSQSASESASQSKSRTITLSVSPTISLTPSVTITPSETSSVAETPSITGTPLVYCVPYPSSTPTAFQTPTSTPLFMMTPWPLQINGSASPSTSPFFMMIPYPSSSPVPFNESAIAVTPIDVTPTIVTGVAVGAMGVGSLLFLLQYLKKLKVPPTQAKEETQEEEVEVNMPDVLTYLCIHTVDLEDVTFLLTLFKKRFHVIDAPVNLTATS